MSSVSIERREEDLIPLGERKQIAELLELCFPNTFEGRIYFKQLPCFRFLAKKSDRIVGQVGLTHRIVRLGDRATPIFGVIDLCVAPEERRDKIGAKLLQTAIAAAKSAGVMFVILFADDQRLYQSLGFKNGSNICTWVAIDSHKILGVRTESLADCLMTLELNGVHWDNNVPLDLLGYLF